MSIGSPQPALADRLPLDRIADVCRKHGVAELAAFGSVLRDDFRTESDVDLLVSFVGNDYGPWMGKLTDLEDELSALLGRKVDLVPRDAVEASPNWIRRKSILSTARLIYGP